MMEATQLKPRVYPTPYGYECACPACRTAVDVLDAVIHGDRDAVCDYCGVAFEFEVGN